MGDVQTNGELEEDLYGLFHEIRHLKNSSNYLQYLNFICRFKKYSAFNVSLVYAQKPNTKYFATKNHWEDEFDRRVKADARPLVMLRPGGPIMFVYDITDTVGEEKLVPEEIEEPFKVSGTVDPTIISGFKEHLVEYRIDSRELSEPMQHGGRVRRLSSNAYSEGRRFSITLNKRQSDKVNLQTLIHELSHIFCGHLRSLEDEKWPHRPSVSRESAEFEAESVGYLVCKRLGLLTSSDHYLAGYLEGQEQIPEISIQAVIRSVEWIEKLIKGHSIKLYKKKK